MADACPQYLPYCHRLGSLLQGCTAGGVVTGVKESEEQTEGAYLCGFMSVLECNLESKKHYFWNVKLRRSWVSKFMKTVRT